MSIATGHCFLAATRVLWTTRLDDVCLHLLPLTRTVKVEALLSWTRQEKMLLIALHRLRSLL